MREASAELAAAIEAQERTTRIRLSVDFDADGHGGQGSIDDLSATAAAVTVEQVLQTTLPAQVAVVEGTAAATLSADLAGGDSDDERLDAVRYFSPLSSSSPLAGKQRLARDVEADVELLTADGWQALPLLRGTVRGMPASVAQRIARLDAIDRRTRLRTKVQLPVMCADAPPYTGFLATPIQPGLEGSWVVSHVLYSCGIPLSPPPRTGCRLWLPMHGSGMPFIAQAFDGSPPARIVDSVTDETRVMEFDTGPFLLATKTPAVTEYAFLQLDAATGPAIFAASGRSTARIECWVKTDGVNGCSIFVAAEDGNAAANFLLTGSTGALRLLLFNGSIPDISGPSVPLDGAWHLIGVHWDDTAGRAVFRIDATSTVATFTPSTTQAGIVDTVSVEVTAEGALAELHITAGLAEADAWLPLTHDPGWTVDRSQLRLDGIASSDAAEGWTILQELAAAEQAAVFYDAAGQGHYATRARLVTAAAQTPQRTVTAAAHILELAYDYQLDQVRNHVSCAYSPIAVTMRTNVWDLAETVSLSPGASRTFEMQASLGTSFEDVEGTANTASDGTGTQYLAALNGLEVSAVPTRTSPTTAQIVVTNHLPVTVWLVDTSGQPNLHLVGDQVAQGSGPAPATFTNQASVDQYGDQPLDLASNRWVQRKTLAHGLAMVTALDLGDPRPVLTQLDIPGDPRLEYFDRITAQDPDNTELAADFWILGAASRFDGAGGYTQTLTCRPTRDRYLAGVGLVGEDLVG